MFLCFNVFSQSIEEVENNVSDLKKKLISKDCNPTALKGLSHENFTSASIYQCASELDAVDYKEAQEVDGGYIYHSYEFYFENKKLIYVELHNFEIIDGNHSTIFKKKFYLSDDKVFSATINEGKKDKKIKDLAAEETKYQLIKKSEEMKKKANL